MKCNDYFQTIHEKSEISAVYMFFFSQHSLNDVWYNNYMRP